MDGALKMDDRSQLPVPATEPPHWKAAELKDAVKVFNGLPVQMQTDTSPDRGSGWMKKGR